MKLQTNLSLKNYLWSNCGSDLMTKFPPAAKEQYPFIFETGDVKTLLLLDNNFIQEYIELLQVYLIETMCQTALEEILSPVQIISCVPSLNKIEIDSPFRLGIVHVIEENTQENGFLLYRFRRQKPDAIIEQQNCSDLDEVINTIAGFEHAVKQNRRSPQKP